MAVTCPACGAVSRDEEFCDLCNADLLGGLEIPAPIVCPLGEAAALQLTPEQVDQLNQPSASITVQHEGQAYRIHWIPSFLWYRWQDALEERAALAPGCLPACRVVFDDEGCWVIVEAARQRHQPWVEAEHHDAFDRARLLADFLPLLRAALESLHAAGLVWLTFDPSEMELLEGRLCFTNLDLGVCPAGNCPPQLNFVPAFAAPEVTRFRGPDIGPRTDVFHLAMFAYYWLAKYLPSGFLGEGLEAFHFAIPPVRIFAPDLPPGVAAVLNRGLDIDPEKRYPSVGAYCEVLSAGLAAADKRERALVSIDWEIGVHSRTGRAKSVSQGANEDGVFLKEWTAPARALVAVADGISSCDVGSGAIASRTACEILDAGFGPDSQEDNFPGRITAACRRGAHLLLDWAIRQGERQTLLAGHRLMGTTLTAAWLESRHLSLANLGDSRAYLIHDQGIEQLTVDGDLGCGLLAAGAPPEEVLEMGCLAKALRDCLGGCYRTPHDTLAIDLDHCRPTVTRWPLLPGDIIVLCTDGLVEEGQFLDPAELADLVREYRAMPPATLAEKLADAADARQRLPSPEAPEGWGDNISCAVIKIRGPDAADRIQ
jgi:protein phosphatase